MENSMQEMAHDAEEELSVEQGSTTGESTSTTSMPNADQAQSQSAPQTQPQTKLDILSELDKLQLAPELKDEFKKGYLRQQDYTKKTQEIAEARKLAEEYQKAKPFYDQVFQDPYVRNKFLGEAQTAPQQPEVPQDPIEYANWVKQQTIAEMEAKLAKDRDIQEASSLDPRLNTDVKFARTIAGLVSQDSDFLTGRKSYTQATKDALAEWESIRQGLLDGYKSELAEKAKGKKLVTSTGNSPVSTSRGKPMSFQEAAAQAEEDLSG